MRQSRLLLSVLTAASVVLLVVVSLWSPPPMMMSTDTFFLAKEKKKLGVVSLVLVADPGDFIGFGEAQALLDAADEDLGPDPKKDLLCVSARRLVIRGSKVLLVTTGIGATRAALCVDSLLEAYGPGVKEVVFLGTAGGSPARGGLIDSDDCNIKEARKEDLVRLGDVCVSPFSTNWDCQRCFWASEPYSTTTQWMRLDSACVRAPCSLHERWDLFGDFACSFFLSTDLSDEILRAVQNTIPIPRPPEIQKIEDAFWSASTGLKETGWPEAAQQRDPPKVFHYTTCAEASSTMYWNGAPYDELARGYVADLINLASMENVTRRDVAAFSAMEGTGWMEVLKLSEVYLHYPDLPAANIRAVSDYTHDPLVYHHDLWFEDPDWLDHSARLNSTRDGYRFAIESTSAVVLALFESRLV